MVRAYPLYFDLAKADWERRGKLAALTLVILAHLALLAWFLRTYPPLPKSATSLVMVMLTDAFAPLQTRHAPAKGSGSATDMHATRHTDSTRASDSTRTPVPEGRLAAGTSDRTSAADFGATTSSAAAASTAGRGALSHATIFNPPRVLHHWRPPYPRDAYEEHIEGETHVLVTVAADGTLKEAHINATSGNEELDQAALDAVHHYTFAAALRDSIAIEAQAIVVVEWSIRPPVDLKVASGMTK